MIFEAYLWALLFQFGRGALVVASIFWIWVLIDCLAKEPSEGNDKVAWTLLIVFVPIIGAGLYYFIRRPERVKAAGR
jgi:hypothetical protein